MMEIKTYPDKGPFQTKTLLFGTNSQMRVGGWFHKFGPLSQIIIVFFDRVKNCPFFSRILLLGGPGEHVKTRFYGLKMGLKWSKFKTKIQESFPRHY